MIFRKAVKDDFDNIKSLYWELIDQEQGDPSFPHWKKGIQPSDEMLHNSIDKKELYVLTDGGEMTFKMYELVLRSMGEKRAYKPRRPGGGRRKSKPEYDAGKILKELMDSAVVLYDAGMSLQAIADELGLNPIKVRKLLITAGVYASDVAEKVQKTFDDFRKTQDHKAAVLSTANALGLSRSSVTSYLPYKKGVYFPCTAPTDKISVGAERQRRYRAMKRCRNATTEEESADVRITARSK